MTRNFIFIFCNIFSLALLCTWSRAELTGRELLDKAQDRTAAAPQIRRVDTSEMAVIGADGQKMAVQKNVVTIEIDLAKHLARQTSTAFGQELIMIKRGDKAAMKLGSGPWQLPAGQYEQIAKDMGNLFVCEIETPEDKSNAPDWKITGSETIDGREMTIIESAGDSAIPLAQMRITKSMAKAIADPAQRPTVKVLHYSAKHWIDKSDFSHRRAIQQSRLQLTMPGGKIQMIQDMTARSESSYEKLEIEIPPEAREILER